LDDPLDDYKKPQKQVRIQGSPETKIYEDQLVALLLNKNVGGRDVPMDEAASVQPAHQLS
jgi:hypothetical protein